MHNDIIFSIFLIFCGAAFLATLALFTRQSLLVAYIILGMIIGPGGMKLISDPVVLKDVGDIGIIFLLFLLGLNLQPQNLLKLLRQTTVITLLSSLVFALVGYSVAIVAHFSQMDAMIVGTAMMFSSTIIGLKLLPTTVLHHQRIGEIVISILLLQDIIAIFTLLLLHGAGEDGRLSLLELGRVALALPGLVLFAFLFERVVLIKIIQRFSRIHEYMFLVAIGWCLGLGQLAEFMKLSFEIGAFIAGISIAQSPISRFIAESLRPLRDFFLILFFFSLGAKLDILILSQIWVWALALASLMLIVKPIVFRPLLANIAPTKSAAWEVGVRIGQISEFSLLVGYTAEKNALISQSAYSLIQISTIITFMVSSYWIVNCYPTPIAVSERLRRD
ncbi:MAG: cation:proton antiporter [Gammaproteobacteria bacterium]|jgi:Kef-type K+ transport system membrane component KefB|nr:cation:proton antiporter [Gammaproteobacteria bacterium]